MKKIILAFFTLGTLNVASAQWPGEKNDPFKPKLTCPDGMAMSGDMCIGVGTCAPEVKEGNVKATDRVLSDLANSELKNATKFKSLITTISQKGSDERLSSYLGLAGVQTDDEIAAFVGSRDGKIDSKYIVELSKNAELTNEQSEMVLKKVSGSLLGERK
jgi:hypothetical protein